MFIFLECINNIHTLQTLNVLSWLCNFIWSYHYPIAALGTAVVAEEFEDEKDADKLEMPEIARTLSSKRSFVSKFLSEYYLRPGRVWCRGWGGTSCRIIDELFRDSLHLNSILVDFIFVTDQISQQCNHKCHKTSFTIKKFLVFFTPSSRGKKNHTWAILGVPGMIGFHYAPVDELNPNGFSVPPVPPHLMYTWPFIGPRYDPVLYRQTTYFSARTYYLMLCLPPLQSCERKASIDGVLKSCVIYNLSNMGCTCMPNWPLDPRDHIAQIYRSTAEG